MAEQLIARCPACETRIRLKNLSRVGSRVRCPRCQQPFVIQLDSEFVEDAFLEEPRTESPPRASHRGLDISQQQGSPAASPVLRATGDPANRWMAAILIGGGLLAVLLIVGVIVVVSQRDPEPPPQIGPQGATDLAQDPIANSETGTTPVMTQPKRVTTPPLVSQQLARQLGNKMEFAASSKDIEAFESHIDWDALVQRTTKDVPGVSPESESAFRRGAANGARQSHSFVKGVFGYIDAAGSMKLLRIHQQDGEMRLLFRTVNTGGAIHYVDYILAPGASGSPKIVDMFIAGSGELMSITLRRFYLVAAARENQGLIDRLSGKHRTFMLHQEKLISMTQATQAKQYRKALAIYRQLPPQLAAEKFLCLIRLNVAQRLITEDDQARTPADEQAYMQAISDFRSIFPDDPAVDLVSIDYFILSKNFNEALNCLDRVDRNVGGDPALNLLRGIVAKAQDDNVTRRRYLTELRQKEPSLEVTYWHLLQLSLDEKKYGETVAILDTLGRTFDKTIPNPTALPEFSEFIKSPEYRAYAKRTRSAP